MDIQQTSQELQKFADSQGMNIDVSTVLDNMDAGDFVELNSAIDSNNNQEIFKILQKYKARMSESFEYFSPTYVLKYVTENSKLKEIDNYSIKELKEAYSKFSTYGDISEFSTQELKALVYEDITQNDTQLNALKTSNIAQQNLQQQQQQINPQTQAKVKQAELQKGTGNMKVSVPGQQSGTDEIEPLVGIDVGQTPQQTLVVTKSGSKPNQVNIFGLDDVTPVQESRKLMDDIDKICTEEKSVQEINAETKNVAPPAPEQSGTPSPVTYTAPGMGEFIHSVQDVPFEDDFSGEESPLGNSKFEQNDEIVNDIIDLCNRMDNRK